MMKKLVLGMLLVGLLAVSAQAAVTEIVGGARDGLAVGLQLESGIARNLTVRGGLEFNTGAQPIIGSVGVKFPLSSLGRMPLALGLGLVGYFGNNHNEVGLSLTFIFNRFLDIEPLFLEAGIDAVGHGRAVVQLGYKVY
jgi:hypothetical protein